MGNRRADRQDRTRECLEQEVEFVVPTVDRRGEIVDRQTHRARQYTQDLGDGAILEMVAIPGGTFAMGSPEGRGYDDEHPQHEVTVAPF